MVQLVTVVNSILAVIPAGVVFFLAYGRYDGTFKDNVVFLFFLGGLLLGFLVGLFTLFALSVPSTVLTPLLLALFYPIAVIVGINRRKWQGERHAVFNGGAMGLGMAVMLSFTMLFALHKASDAETYARGGALAVGLTTLLFAVGLLAGNAVRLRKPFRIALLGAATLIAPAVFLVSYANDRAWLWLGLLVAYGLVYAVVAERRLLIEGVEGEARKMRRRLRRRASE